jgi:DNA-directed RNA polymerase specialized sigma subunit
MIALMIPLSNHKMRKDAIKKTEVPQLAQQVTLHRCHRYNGMKLREIGKRFGIGESGVTQAIRRIGMRAEKKKRLRVIVKTIETRISLSSV